LAHFRESLRVLTISRFETDPKKCNNSTILAACAMFRSAAAELFFFNRKAKSFRGKILTRMRRFAIFVGQ